jgi:hypothetical protein
LLALAAIGATEACSDVSGGNRRAVQLSVTSKTSSGIVASVSPGTAFDLKVGSAGDLILTKAQVVVDDIELNQKDGDNCNGDFENQNDDDNSQTGDENVDHTDGCAEVTGGPLLIDIPLDNSVKPVLTVPLAAGTYTGLDIKIAPADADETTFNGANPTLVGKSVRVEGTFKGTPFVFTSPIRAAVESRFDPPLVIDATTRNATVNIDVAKWFLDSNGNAIDPTLAAPGNATQRQIENNIRASFHAFDDDNESGIDDQEEHGDR